MRPSRAVIAFTVVVVSLVGSAHPLAARTTLDLCNVIPRRALEDRIGTPLGTPHDGGTEPIAAGCHFPAQAIGGTDVGLYASNNVRLGIQRSYGGSFFATLDNFQRVYGTPTPVDGIAGATAYVAFTPGHLAQGAVLALRGTKQAVLIVLVGQYVTARNTVSRGRGLVRAVLTALART